MATQKQTLQNMRCRCIAYKIQKKFFDFALLTIEICFVGGDQDLETYFVHDNITWFYIRQKSSWKENCLWWEENCGLKAWFRMMPWLLQGCDDDAFFTTLSTLKLLKSTSLARKHTTTTSTIHQLMDSWGPTHVLLHSQHSTDELQRENQQQSRVAGKALE